MIFDNERLVSARKMNGYSLQKLADKLTKSGHPITKQALSKYEKGKAKPNNEMYWALIDALGIKPDYFARTTREIKFGEIHWCNLKGRYY